MNRVFTHNNNVVKSANPPTVPPTAALAPGAPPAPCARAGSSPTRAAPPPQTHPPGCSGPKLTNLKKMLNFERETRKLLYIGSRVESPKPGAFKLMGQARVDRIRLVHPRRGELVKRVVRAVGERLRGRRRREAACFLLSSASIPGGPSLALAVALQVEFERQFLKPAFHLIGYRLWV